MSIIGAGRLGSALAIAIHKAGYFINLIVARHAASAERASKLAGQGQGLSAKHFRQLLPEHRELLEQSSLIIIATPDDMVASIADELRVLMSFKEKSRRDQVALHTSGALGSDVLAPLRKVGMPVGAMHPLVSISEPRTGAEWLTRAYFSVEGDPAAVRAAKRLVRDLGGHPFAIPASAKPLYHAAALMASPNLTALVDIALEMLNHCGLSANQSRKVLLPLISSTIDNLSDATPWNALTGTFKRGDVATVQKHVDAISSQKLFDALGVYVLLGRRSMKLSNHKSASQAEIDQILGQAFSRALRRP